MLGHESLDFIAGNLSRLYVQDECGHVATLQLISSGAASISVPQHSYFINGKPAPYR